MRGASLLLVVVACDQQGAGGSWTEIEVVEAEGVSFTDVSVVGDVAIAVGSRDAGRGAALVIDGDSWTAIDTPDLPPLDHVFAAAPDDIWAGTYGDDAVSVALLWRWDGTAWVPVELPAPILSVHDLWGTGPDDVWIAAQFDGPSVDGAGAYHWDGSGLTAKRDFFEMLGVEEGTTTPLSMRAGCSPTPGEVWLAGGLWLGGDEMGNADGRAFHFDGEVWRVHEMLGMPRDLACLETQMWYLGEAGEDGPFLGNRQGDMWALQARIPWNDVLAGRVASLDIVAGAPWMVGDENESRDAASAQVWRVVDGTVVRTIDEFEARETPDDAMLRALYETPAGTIRALGVDGLILDHAGEW